jgi:lipoprotein-releasing system permease protein
MAAPPPFSRYEFFIAWRYLRARRAEGGVSVMTWISFLGIALAVAALIATLAVRSGFRYEFVGTILGANPHVSVYDQAEVDENGRVDRTLENYEEVAAGRARAARCAHAAAVVRGQVMASNQGRNAGVEVIGIAPGDLVAVPLVAEPEVARGDIGRFSEGIAIGSGVARELGLDVGDTRAADLARRGADAVRHLAARLGLRGGLHLPGRALGHRPGPRLHAVRRGAVYFNRDGVADEIEVMLDDPEDVAGMVLPILTAAGGAVSLWTWQDSSGAFLQALQMEDNIMFVILSILVLIATMNIVSGLIMLVKNKSRDIGILRTMGIERRSVLRVFFICGSAIGVAGTVAGVALGCAFAIWIDPIFDFVNWLAGGGVWDPSVRFLSSLPARLEWGDVLSAVSLSLGLSFLVTIFPARRAARMNPVEALRYE